MAYASKYAGKSMWDVPFKDLFDEWERRTNGYKDQLAVRALALYDRYFLLVQICRRVDLLHPWVYARCREVERAPDGRLDLWAREHNKSSIITFGGTIQEVLNDPEITVCIFSHTKSVAEKFLMQIKLELEKNERLLKLFPDVLFENPQKDSDTWSNSGITVKRLGNPKEPTVSASGLVDGMPTGMHYRLRIYDDVVVPASVNTPEQITKTTDAYSLSQSLGVQDGREWGIGTRYSYADTYEWILTRHALLPRIYPATEDGTKDGKPVYFTQAEWAKRCLKQTDSDIACQMLQNPLSGEQRMFDIEMLQVYEVRPETLAVYIMVDPARSKKTESDNTAIVVLGVDYAMNKYLLDGMNHRMDLSERWKNTEMLYRKWRSATGVQAVYVGYESFGAQADLDYFVEQMKKPDATRFEIKELAWPREGGGSKIDRVQRLTPDFKAGKFYLPYETIESKLTTLQRKVKDGYAYRISRAIRRKDSEGNIYDLSEQFRMQAHYFPFGGKKDLVDAASRIYDMEPRAPSYREQRYYEPEFT